MLSEAYQKKFSETISQVKTAAGPNSFIGFLRPFRNMSKYESFAKQLMKDQPWMAKAGLTPTDMLRHIQETSPIKSIAARISGYNKKGILRHGNKFRQDFMKAHPEQFAQAEKALHRSKMLTGAGLGAGGALGLGAYLSNKKTPEQYY